MKTHETKRVKTKIGKGLVKSPNLLVDTWGYPMTFVEFYKILTRNKFTVEIIRIGSEILGDAQKFNGFSGKVVPDLAPEVVGEKLLADIHTDEAGKEYFLLSLENDVPHYLREWNGHAMRFNHLSND